MHKEPTEAPGADEAPGELHPAALAALSDVQAAGFTPSPAWAALLAALLSAFTKRMQGGSLNIERK